MLSFKLCFIAIILCAPILYANSHFSIIVSKQSNIQQMSNKDVSRVFLSKTKELPNGQKAITIEPNEKEYQELFYEKICGKTQKQIKRYWATVLFSGKGQPPKKMKKVEEIIEFVKNNNNAIAYVPTALLRSNDIKIVLELK